MNAVQKQAARNFVWGKDVSGARDGAAGIGGLLYLTANGVVYVPQYDVSGNILAYCDANGNIVASYTYDAFGNTIAQSGPLAGFFRHRFSTKYFDFETGLYYYGYRHYSPALMRWLTRDPIEEDGGVNLYVMCGNNAMCRYDMDGQAYFAYRSLDVPIIGRDFGVHGWNWQNERSNRVVAHEQLVFEDSGEIINLGYGHSGMIVNEDMYGYINKDKPGRYNDCLMHRAVNNVKPKPYSMLGWFNSLGRYNCQSYADDLRKEYDRLMVNPCERKKCGLK